MVFQSLVVGVLNRLLGDYIENLDANQLEVGVWGGDVVLRNLDLRPTALDALNLPVKLKAGFLGTLTLKVPWQNLYTEAVVADVEDLYVVATPNLGITYDARKEEKLEQDAKQNELQRIEERRKTKRKKPDKEGAEQDTFAEKLVTQMVKNLQVTVRRVHIRYEDQFTNPERPFAAGVTLNGLVFQTTDNNWRPCVLQQAAQMFHKLVHLDSLSLYWNSGTTILVSHLTKKEEIKYQDMLQFFDAQERLHLNAMYRKYRPNLPYKGHAKEWWHFAINCILKEQIQRKNKNWSWAHMKEHRNLVRRYSKAWVAKRTNMNPSKDDLDLIKDAEHRLDVFNLNIARQQAELHIDREHLKRVEEQTGFLNYMKSWFGGGRDGSEDLTAKFDNVLTQEERVKLYGAIDYYYEQHPTAFPKEFIENRINLSLDTLSIVVHDDVAANKRSDIIILSVQSVSGTLEQRPSADAVSVNVKTKAFELQGLESSDGQRPMIISVDALPEEVPVGPEMPELEGKFETNPLDGSFDQFVKIRVRPHSIVYDAPTVNRLVDVFRPPESVQLKELTTAAFSVYENLMQWSATGFKYALEKRSVLKLDIECLPTIVQIPYRGVMNQSSDILVLDLGKFRVFTFQTSTVKTDDEFYRLSEEEKLKVLLASAYDKFKIELTSIQILFARTGENWRKARERGTTRMHFLQPAVFRVLLEKASVEDVRLPKLRISCELPDLRFTASDTRILDIIKLIASIPLAESSPEIVLTERLASEGPSSWEMAKMRAILEATGDELEEALEETAPQGETKVKSEQIQVELSMYLKQISIETYKRTALNGPKQPYLKLCVSSIATNVVLKPLDLRVMASVGGAELQHMQYKAPGRGGPLYLLENPMKAVSTDPLVQLDFGQADQKSPDFVTKFDNTGRSVKIKGQKVRLMLHQQAILDVHNFVQALQKKLDEQKKGEHP